MHVLFTFLRKRMLIGLVLFCAFFSSQIALGQRVALKTNALEYVFLTPNLTLEARLSQKLSLQVGVAANPMQTPIGKYKTANFRVEPELRYWFNRPMARHFSALSTSAGSYNLQLYDRLLKFNSAAAGVSYGYALVLGRHWNVEFELGAGLAYVNGLDYKKGEEEPESSNMKKVVPVPIRAAISFGYIFK